MSTRLIECVPNFSEGQNLLIINQIAAAIENVRGVKLLHVDIGKAANRTVMTFVGSPESVIEAAFLAIQKAAELIDMRNQRGEHPRIGATDVCPLVPITGVSMAETVQYAHQLAKRVAENLQIPIYCYEYAALQPNRKNLATIRAGEYEGLAEKMKSPEWIPDFGQPIFNAKAGATVIGARDFLIAYNFNLNTTVVALANAVAFDVREIGRIMEENGKKVFDTQGKPVRQAGTCPGTKAIGWFIKEYGIAQVSMNLTNTQLTPLHIAFEEVCKSATNRGLRVTGSELIGLIPLQVLLDAGKYFLNKQKQSAGVSESELIKIAVKSLGLADLKPFEPSKRIIEYLLKEQFEDNISSLTINEFANEIANISPAPAGGSVAAYVGTLGIALGTMVANLSTHKKGLESKWQLFSDWAVQGQMLKQQLIEYVDMDTKAFQNVMEAYKLSKNTPKEQEVRQQGILLATQEATEVPLQVMKTALKGFILLEAMAKEGNKNLASDIGVGVLCLCAAIRSAELNIRINTKTYLTATWAIDKKQEAAEITRKAMELEQTILNLLTINLG